MDDNSGDNTCTDDLQMKNSWSVSGNTITVRTDITGKGGSNNLGGGFDFNPGGCKYTVTRYELHDYSGNNIYTGTGSCLTGSNPIGITAGAETNDYVSWLIDMEYCGDGQCNCGETCTSCPGDCGVCDTTPPTSKIISIKNSAGTDLIISPDWLKADTYTIVAEDYDNAGGSGLDFCQLGIFDATVGSWTYKNRTCNSAITFVVANPSVNPSADCKTQDNINGCGVWTIARDKVGLYSNFKDRKTNTDGNYRYYGADWTPPTGQ